MAEIQGQQKSAVRESPTVGRIRQLEKAINDMQVKVEDVEEMKQTYLRMVDRLKSETVIFGRDLQKISASVHAKEHDNAELELLVKEALHRRDEVVSKQKELEHLAAKQHKHHKHDALAWKRKLEKRKQRCVNHELRMKDRVEELRTTEEEALATIRRIIKNPTTVQEELDQIEMCKAEFTQIKNAIGASEVQEIINKFLQQEDVYNLFSMMTKESQKQISTAKAATAEAQDDVMRLRYQEALDAADEDNVVEGAGADSSPPDAEPGAGGLGDSGQAEAGERWTSRHEDRLRHTCGSMISARGGMQHLLALLHNAPGDFERPQIAEVSEENILEVRLNRPSPAGWEGTPRGSLSRSRRPLTSVLGPSAASSRTTRGRPPP